MKPISLTISAFGPFCKTMTLDFDDLKNHKLFLIAGPTGAGKTTILDAMVFALFGETSGGLRSGQTMRSDYADDETPTKVEFIFSIGTQQYRIERQPKQELKKRRGTGTRMYEATAILWSWQDGAWQEYSSRSTDIANKIQEILGFRLNQFLQVVLLPQGEFRKLLVANTSDREALMHSLFKTDVFKRLQDMLKDEYDEVVASAKTVIDRQQYLLQSENVDTYAALKDSLTVKQQGLSDSETKFAAFKKDFDAVTKIYDNNVKRAQLEQELERFRQREETLLGKRAEMNAVDVIVKQLAAYKPIAMHKQRIDELNTEQQALNDSLFNLAESLKEIVKEKAQLTAEYEKLQSLEDTRKAYESILQEALKTKQKLAEADLLDKKIATDSAKLALEEENIKGLNEELEQRRALMMDLEQKQNELRAAVDGEGMLLNEQTLWNDGLRHVNSVQQAGAQLQQAEQSLQRATLALVERQTEELQAQAELKLAKAQAVQQQAAHLADELEDGVACPVCGSLEHPHKATYIDDFNADVLAKKEKAHEGAVRRVSAAEADVDSATKLQAEKAKNVQEAVQVYTDWLEQQIAKVKGLLDSYKGVTDWGRLNLEFTEHSENLKPLLNQIGTKRGQLQRIEKQLKDGADSLKKLDDAVAEAQRAYGDAEKQLAVKQAELDVLRRELPTGDLDAWQADLDEKETWVTNHIEAVKANEQARLANNRRETSCGTDEQNKKQRLSVVQDELQKTKELYERALAKADLSEARMSELNSYIDKKETLEEQL
ncbi:MAG: SMC family ATPase [Veillonella sp.]|uniref:AAA family ATPase n=1 Tax=Veillonella sp. TaxID=1926307 RepID=UPI0025CF8CF3|nr:SMC family ATPase [Veillonella sp.]MBS4914344.1 SMC family ATPase [Veillonella sp.]